MIIHKQINQLSIGECTLWFFVNNSESNWIWNCSFLRTGENRSVWEKPLKARVETKNKLKQNMPWRHFRGVRVEAALVWGECSHHFATLADPLNYFLFASPFLVCLSTYSNTADLYGLSIYNGETKASHCKCPYKSGPNIVSKWNDKWRSESKVSEF